MAKNGKLKKLRCMIKRWNSSNRISRTGGGGSDRSQEDDAWHAASFHGDDVPAGFHPVYVGKSRRRYIVNCDLVEHPLFQNLVERSDSGADSGGGGDTVVGCEVVLFEHLLWMLENADPQPDSLDELVHFYEC
ncbi:auxin-responsive protein SAUR78 [Dendrobium catenatum]|uniref:Indole-3-acetic acid-induced protein ARG7 n=1 Tax=Dendrobium catenatum TaxID=906689 RepID=A0A2I0WF06_9ASPA|nr:auxin-responsive protein SAUR78 [Dendrobium catenatum]PKU74251.1 Indole-3-acetic acid-induced protein ARG7 [Dendrobium catenatum]